MLIIICHFNSFTVPLYFTTTCRQQTYKDLHSVVKKHRKYHIIRRTFYTHQLYAIRTT